MCDPDKAINEQYEEINQLKDDLQDERLLREKLAGLLERTANALKGQPEPLHLHDWSDLPEVATQLKRDLIDPTSSKIPLWILCGMEGKPEWDKGKLVPNTMKFYLFGFYLDEEHCKMAKRCLEQEHQFRDTKIWIDKSEANHMWVWDITEGP